MSRTCGNCAVCCFVGAVPAIRKPAHCACPHQEGKGCSIYGASIRPKVCSDFQCAWLRGAGHLGDRPDLSNVMCSFNAFNGGQWVFVIETKPNAALTTGKNIIHQLSLSVPFPVIIVDYGKKPPNDFGDRVVVKDSLASRSKRIAGKFLRYLDDQRSIKVHELIVGAGV